MRFVIAACAACLILMCDFDASSFQQKSIVDDTAPRREASSPLLPLVELFLASVQAIEQTNARAELVPAIPAPDAVEADEQPSMSPSDQFCHALRKAAEASGIPVPFFARLLWQESRFRSNEVSPAGAQGVAQFMPETAAEVGLDNPFDPMQALPASARLLRKLRDDFGNLGLAAAAYNAGSGRIQKWLGRQSALPRETRDYVRIITGTKAEDWIEDADTLAIRIDLPREAPCEGVGGLSKARKVAHVPASAAANVLALIRKAEMRIAGNRARKRFALLLKKGKARNVIAARVTAKSARGRPLRLASSER
ncbi:lytic transglycosylase domain-containing protein [Bradyrhizobium guangdongense]|uniref:lytic transglycosylase domain-containing protein n=1 Tax=Bradyrhizobium guangdongense TaxID=1325090 RepID=UPI001129783F|nr:lytic transglycosylase domain-containing protein [Bradyrhizobium guangdongense]TPQ29524.1 lytic transglycosylase domain-containing protein [Bradyrhizobium guangdongense]